MELVVIGLQGFVMGLVVAPFMKDQLGLYLSLIVINPVFTVLYHNVKKAKEGK